MKPLHTPQNSEVVKLGPPASGEVIVTVNPSLTGSAYSAGLQTLLPGAETPVHRCLDRDRAVFIHKGQGRATLNDQTTVVLPGAMVYVPRGAWHGVRNTGTGALQLVWVSAPPGLEIFFRELSHLGASPAAEVLQDLARRHQIEFRPADAVVPPAGPPHRRRRGGRRRRSGRGSAPRPASTMPASGPAHVQPAAPPVVPSSIAAAPSTPALTSATTNIPRGSPRLRSGRHRRRGGGRPRSAPPAASPSAAPPKASPTAVGAERPRSSRGYRSHRVKEVYMGGRWVKVEGGEPVIAPGRDRGERGGSKRNRDDEPPPIRLSVPL